MGVCSTVIQLFKVPEWLLIPPSVRNVWWLYPFTTCGIFNLFKFNHGNEYIIGTHCSINLFLWSLTLSWLSFYVLVAHLCILFWKSFFKSATNSWTAWPLASWVSERWCHVIPHFHWQSWMPLQQSLLHSTSSAITWVLLILKTCWFSFFHLPLQVCEFSVWTQFRLRNAGSLTHWARPGIQLASSWVLVVFFTAEPRRELRRLPYSLRKFWISVKTQFQNSLPGRFTQEYR